MVLYEAKNAPIFSKHAEEILTLFNLTHLCTTFVLVVFTKGAIRAVQNVIIEGTVGFFVAMPY